MEKTLKYVGSGQGLGGLEKPVSYGCLSWLWEDNGASGTKFEHVCNSF